MKQFHFFYKRYEKSAYLIFDKFSLLIISNSTTCGINFKHKVTRVDDMENEPAYKRMGLDIDENIPEGSSRLSLDSDSNEDLQLRSNNSFLHDNVD